MINEGKKKWRAIEQKVEPRYEMTREQKKIDRKAYGLRNKPYCKLRKKERQQLICEMILYCSPEFEVSAMNRYSKQSELKNEKRKRDNRKTCAYSPDNERSK